MLVYITLLFIYLLVAGINKSSRLFGGLLFLLLFIISASRGVNVGIDTVNYYNNYFSSLYSGDNHDFEIVFITICDFIRDNGLNPRCCLYILSFITFFFIYLAAGRFNTSLVYVGLFYILFNLYTHSFNIARQMAACSILLYAYSFLFVDNKRSKLYNIFFFLLFTLFAASFHVGAILGVIALIVIPFRSKPIATNGFIVSVVFIFLFGLIQIFRTTMLSQSIGLLSSIAIYDSLGADTQETSLSLLGFIYRSIAYVIYGIAWHYLQKDSRGKLCDFFGASVILRIVLSAFYGNIYRLAFYFSVIDIVVFSMCSTPKNRRVFMGITVSYFFFDQFTSQVIYLIFFFF